MKKEIIFEQIYESAAGIDIGSEMIYATCPTNHFSMVGLAL